MEGGRRYRGWCVTQAGPWSGRAISAPVDALPKQVPAVRTQPTYPARSATPTTDIVDNLLGEVVHGRLTKDSLPISTSGDHELDRGRVQSFSANQGI